MRQWDHCGLLQAQQWLCAGVIKNICEVVDVSDWLNCPYDSPALLPAGSVVTVVWEQDLLLDT